MLLLPLLSLLKPDSPHPFSAMTRESPVHLALRGCPSFLTPQPFLQHCSFPDCDTRWQCLSLRLSPCGPSPTDLSHWQQSPQGHRAQTTLPQEPSGLAVSISPGTASLSLPSLAFSSPALISVFSFALSTLSSAAGPFCSVYILPKCRNFLFFYLISCFRQCSGMMPDSVLRGSLLVGFREHMGCWE